MSREGTIGASIMVGAGIVLVAFSPDNISIAFVLMMIALAMVGYFAGIRPLIRYKEGFLTARAAIQSAMKVETSNTWYAVRDQDHFFDNSYLDEQFREYAVVVEDSRKRGTHAVKQLDASALHMGEDEDITADIDQFINTDLIRTKTMQGLVEQIPGAMTGLGILGTFIGLFLGLDQMGFTSVNTTVASIEVLLAGVRLAFFTSISGVIMSLIFNFFYHTVWNQMVHQLQLFERDFHQFVIPDQELLMNRKRMRYQRYMADSFEKLLKRLDIQ